MPVDEALLSQKYDLVKLSVINSTSISKRTAAIIAQLGDASPKSKIVVIALTAKSRAANKLISIVEIAKRELATRDTTCFQYNDLICETIEIKRNPNPSSSAGGADKDDDEDDDSENAFETMGAQTEAGLKKRTVPVMTTYLSISSVKELKVALG